jgi:hypothetical protein
MVHLPFISENIGGSKEASIYDIFGRVMHKQSVNVGENKISADLPAGKYFLVIDGEIQTVRAEISIF